MSEVGGLDFLTTEGADHAITFHPGGGCLYTTRHEGDLGYTGFYGLGQWSLTLSLTLSLAALALAFAPLALPLALALAPAALA